MTLLRVHPKGLETGLFCTLNDMHPSFSSSKGSMSLSEQHCDSEFTTPLTQAPFSSLKKKKKRISLAALQWPQLYLK